VPRRSRDGCRALIATAVEEVEGFRSGIVAAVQTAGDSLGVNPHVHAIAPRGRWDSEGQWVPVPFVNTDTAEQLFRLKVLSFLKAEGLLSEERVALLLSRQHHSGFSIDTSVKVEPEDFLGRRKAPGAWPLPIEQSAS